MAQNDTHQQIINPSGKTLSGWVESFLIDRRAQNLTAGSVKYYREKIQLFTAYCDAQSITGILEITPDTIRRFLLYLKDKGHNPGGVHSAFRSLRAFLYWWENEAEPEGWKNPIRKVKPPRLAAEIIEPVELADIQKMLAACDGKTFTGTRDSALLLFLLDTGIRAGELCALELADIDLTSGAVLVRQGKGRKPRFVFLAQRARRAFRHYLKKRNDANPAAWRTVDGERLHYGGLRQILERRAKLAGVPVPSPHDFRRAFALNYLRNGGDIYSLQLLMGHSDLQVLRRYLKQSQADLQEAHRRGSPVDNSKL